MKKLSLLPMIAFTTMVMNAQMKTDSIYPFPNPANKVINIPYKLYNQSSELKIFDSIGRLISEIKTFGLNLKSG